MTVAAATQLRTDIKILSLVSAGHFVSHFYYYALPSFFIFLHDDLGYSYTALGLLVSGRALANGFSAVPAGFLVDRFGAKLVLIGGMLVMVTAYALMGLADAYWLLLLLSIFGGVGDSVFHPADYSILNGSVSNSWIGRAFSMHTFMGNLGLAAAPPMIAWLCTAYDWRTTFLIVGVAGYIAAGLLVSQWSSLKDDALTSREAKPDVAAADGGLAGQLRLLSSPPLLMLFAFFTMTTLANSAIGSFTIPALHAMQGVSAVDAGVAITAYSMAGTLSVLAGGWIADHIKSQDRFTAVGFTLATLAILLVALLPMSYAVLIFAFAFAGFWQGAVRPARDMMVRKVAPAGQTGKVFAFVFSGQSFGGAIAPIALGAIFDHYPPEYVYYASVVFTALCVGVVLLPKGRRNAPA
jgi:FSR family fosmidomycin resistance protein-like MFS transporter